jgi:Protein of unknown function (DUF3142)
LGVSLKPITIFCAVVFTFAGCNRSNVEVSGRLPQRGYIWQREWTPAVIDSLREGERRLNGVVLLGAEINFSGKSPQVVKASIDWDAVRQQTQHCSLALRVAPFAEPFRAGDAPANTIVDVAKQLLDDARSHDVKIEEFQFDFDCAQKNLGAYRTWLSLLRPIVRPVRFLITVLPAWLDDANFVPLLVETDGYVLQVHSVPISARRGTTLCDSKLAREWIARAGNLRIPFSVALPTYRCAAGYARDGKLLSVAMDSVQPSWPPGTRVLEFGADADELAALVHEWQKARPPQLRELIWYRVPIATDTRNWRWPTLEAVMAGSPPKHQLSVRQEGANPVDLSIMNAGQADEQLNVNVTAKWSNAELQACDALSGWRVRSENGRAVFSSVAQSGFRLPPGATRKIGWLRFDQSTTLQTEFSN